MTGTWVLQWIWNCEVEQWISYLVGVVVVGCVRNISRFQLMTRLRCNRTTGGWTSWIKTHYVENSTYTNYPWRVILLGRKDFPINEDERRIFQLNWRYRRHFSEKLFIETARVEHYQKIFEFSLFPEPHQAVLTPSSWEKNLFTWIIFLWNRRNEHEQVGKLTFMMTHFLQCYCSFSSQFNTALNVIVMEVY